MSSKKLSLDELKEIIGNLTTYGEFHSMYQSYIKAVAPVRNVYDSAEYVRVDDLIEALFSQEHYLLYKKDE